MNFKTFYTSTTNIFPITNSTTGGQLVTEWNLRLRESVATPESVKYHIGPSFVHSEEDFYVSVLSDESGLPISSNILSISPGLGVVNGHGVQTLAPMQVDLAEANAQAKINGETPLSGALTIGIRAMYSTLSTMIGAMNPENEDSVFEGLQIVVLPSNEFKLPIDSPTDEYGYTAHIKLAEFNFVNGMITPTSIPNNYPAKCHYLDAGRIGNADSSFSDIFVSKKGLNPKKLYTFAGKGKDTATGLDTWCDSTDSLMVWDVNPQLVNTPPVVSQATFIASNPNGKTQLILPHKQVDGMTDVTGNAQYYRDVAVDLPLADFNRGTGGTVDKNYTNSVKKIVDKISTLYALPNGKLRGVIETLAEDGRIRMIDTPDHLPPIPVGWQPGDFILVASDLSVGYINTEEIGGQPSTMYVVMFGMVASIGTITNMVEVSSPDIPFPFDDATKLVAKTELVRRLDADLPADATTAMERFNASSFYAQEGDYFVGVTQDIGTGKYYAIAYLVNSVTNPINYADGLDGRPGPIFLTGQFSYATEQTIGGFLNVDPTTATDMGYVYRNGDGHLQLVDYALLRSGVLAYQLGQDQTAPAGVVATDVQLFLDENVNERVAFPNATHIQSATHPNVINVTIELTNEETPGTINIRNIDSRFGTCVYLHLIGTADTNTVVNISDCEKIRIDSSILGNPVINLNRSSLYYDPSVIDKLSSVSDFGLWYERFEDTDASINVDGLTVRESNAPVIAEDVDFWTLDAPNDNHFMYGLRSITFNSNAEIVGCEMYVSNQTTSNVTEGHSIISATFEIPQGSGLEYPVTKLTKPVKVSGTFTTAYPTTSPVGYMTCDTNFTAVSQVYDPATAQPVLTGSIAFHTVATLVQVIFGLPPGTSLDMWESGSWHIFSGGVVG